MPGQRSPAALLRAAHLYYVDQKSQAEVARELETSRSNVSRMLAEAQRQGIVEIRLHDPSGRSRDLEAQLADHFGLAEARVAPRGAGRASTSQDRTGALAAGLLLESLEDGMTVALSWGGAVQSTVYAVTTEHEHEVTLVQLLGGISAISNEVSGQELVRELAIRLGASYRLMHAPATLESAAACSSLLAESAVESALALARTADIAVVGIGDPAHGSSAAVVESMRLGALDLASFWDAGPVGDLAGRYFAADGAPVHGAVDDRVVSVQLGDLDRMPLVIGVACGRSKTRAALGALRGHHVDALVCDESLARSLLSHDPT